MTTSKSGLYVHIPFCVKRCGYCAFVSCTDFSRQKVYVEAVVREIESRAADGAFDSIYFGGGTPSTLYRGGLTTIVSALRNNFRIVAPEITVECNPDSADDAFFDECARLGVNRFSIGLQTTDDLLLRYIGRPHTYKQFERAYRAARQVTDNVSLDLMLGFPRQTTEDICESVETVCALEPAHVSLYALKVEEGTPLHADGFCPDEDLQADMYDRSYAILKGAGYRRYEVSNFARPGRESRHNRKYWTMAPYFGFGAAAHSFTGTERVANSDNIAAYIAGAPAVVTPETPDDYMEEYIMLALRTSDGILLSDFKRRFGRDLLTDNADAIRRLSQFLTVGRGRLRLKDEAYYVMNTIIAALLP